MNKVILMGRLTREPEIRFAGETAVARYTLAVDRRRRRDDNQPSADFISCVAFGKSAEFVEKYLHKGTKILVTGRIQTGSYVNKDGNRVYTTDVVVEDHEFAESRAAASGGAPAAPAAAADATVDDYGDGPLTQEPGNDAFLEDYGEDEELPFQ